MVRNLPFVCVVITAACGSPSTPNTPSSGDAPWKELRIAWDYGPCPNDGKSCHQTLSLNYDGGFIAAETPNAAGAAVEPLRRFSALDSQEIRELHRVATAAFVDKLGSFGCPPEADATVRIDIDGPGGTRKEEVGGCVHATGTESPPRALVEMLEHHRWANHDARSTHPKAPSGRGDPCTVGEGCSNGLTCAPSPCVVAPCEWGSCQ